MNVQGMSIAVLASILTACSASPVDAPLEQATCEDCSDEQAATPLGAAGEPQALSVPPAVEEGSDIMPLPAGVAGGSLVEGAEDITSTIVPILLIPQGSSVTPAMQTALTQALGNVRRWYIRELPSKNLTWDSLKIINGDLTAQQYLTNNTVWNVMPAEIQAKLGWNPWDSSSNRHIALVIGRDLLGWAGGNGVSCEGRGMAILGLESLVERVKCRGSSWCTEEMWMGTAIHELGHAFGLLHDSAPASIMSFHDNYRCRHLVPAHAATVECSLASAMKYPNGAGCSTDYVCASKRCGGNGTGSDLVCLPGSQDPKDAQNIPDSHFCREPYQCQSGKCELHWNGYKVCFQSSLPQYISPFLPDIVSP